MKRIVLKVGSAVLTEQNRLAKERMQNLVEFIAELKRRYEVILVSSGAVAAGYTELKLDKKELKNKQVLAAVGQPLLMNTYQKKFQKYEILTSQLLLTADDFDSRKRTAHAKNAIDTMLLHGVLPIINENDVTATEELVFGDNDRLSAHAAYHFAADMLVILTDIDGYYDRNPRENLDAKMLKVVKSISQEELSAVASPNNSFATGGIVTKLMAADFLLQKGIPTYLSSGFELRFAKEYLIDGVHNSGTLFTSEETER